MIEKGLIQKIEGLKEKKPIYRDYRAGDVRHSQANIDKSKALLGYQPKYKVSEGMNETVDWYISKLVPWN
jgi:UDP-N-acetylglucosamine 4-epimerase